MRVKYSFFNLIGSLGSYFVATIFTFITQACIVKLLGIEYSGVNGLFTNIITMLSVAELGIGTTIIFKLYKPLADNDVEKIKSWMEFYKLCYRIVGIFVTIVGLLIVPIVPLIVGEINIAENIKILYFISLLDTILSYVMTYKRSILYADQKNYIINIVHIGYIVFMNVTQIILLTTFKNYYLFLVVKLVYRLLENILINLYVDKKYPYINDNSEMISKTDKEDVLDRVKAMFLQKVSFVINKGIDNIVISCILGIVAVGIYTNYFTIVAAITAIIYQIVSSFTASVGNLLTENDTNKNFDIYKKINLFNSAITTLGTVGFINCVQPFIEMWIGSEYKLSVYIVLSFGLYIYTDSIRRTITIFKEAAGICKEDKWMYVIMALINLVLSIVLCKFIGISGVILGTALSYIFLIFYSYPKYIFKPVFKKENNIYYRENIKYFCLTVCSIIISYELTNIISINNVIFRILINVVISVVTTILVFIVYLHKTNEYKYYVEMLKNNIIKRFTKNNKSIKI